MQGHVTLGRALLSLYIKLFMTWPRGLKCRLCNLCHNQLGTPSDTPRASPVPEPGGENLGGIEGLPV